MGANAEVEVRGIPKKTVKVSPPGVVGAGLERKLILLLLGVKEVLAIADVGQIKIYVCDACWESEAK